jgi:Cu2+-containing amine oxidase
MAHEMDYLKCRQKPFLQAVIDINNNAKKLKLQTIEHAKPSRQHSENYNTRNLLDNGTRVFLPKTIN